jgi:hypothetical protein
MNPTFDSFTGVIAELANEKFFEGGIYTSLAWVGAVNYVTNRADEMRAAADQTDGLSDEQRELFKDREVEAIALLQWTLPQIPADSTYRPTAVDVMSRITTEPTSELNARQRAEYDQIVELSLGEDEDPEFAKQLMYEDALANQRERYDRLTRFTGELTLALEGAFKYADENRLDLDPDGFVPSAFLQRRILVKIMAKAEDRIASLRRQAARRFGKLRQQILGDIVIVRSISRKADAVCQEIERDLDASVERVSEDMA